MAGQPYARIAQLVEHDLAKVGVAGSSPVSRSITFDYFSICAVITVDRLNNSSDDQCRSA